MTQTLKEAKEILHSSDAIFITAGAGMGVDSGLPDFRGDEGFWREYPKVKELGLSFEEMANPQWFESDPKLAWAFYGHRLNLYRNTTPHIGFSKLLQLAKSKRDGYFIFTSNVDGQFGKAGFDDSSTMECHGSISHLQCIDNCQKEIWSADGVDISIDENFQALEPLPTCPYCGNMARPNILMFGDFGWEYSRTDRQRERLTAWLDNLKERNSSLAIIEMGAGEAVPTVRNSSQRIAREFDTPLIRINPRDSHDAPLGIPLGAVEALSHLI